VRSRLTPRSSFEAMNTVATNSKGLQWLLLAAVLWSTAAVSSAQQPPASAVSANRHLSILTALGQHEYARAVADSEALILNDPGFALVYEKLVDAARRSGELEQARVFLTSLLTAPANNPRGHFGVGLIARERGEQAAAIEEYRQCLRMLPEFLPAYMPMVDAYRALDRLPEVEPFIQSLPQTAASRYGLSYLRYVQGGKAGYEQAIELSEQALLLNAHLVEAYKIKAQSLFSLGRYADARQAAQTLLQEVTEPEKIELRLSGLILKGSAAAATGNLVEALEDLTSAYRGIVEVGNLALEENVHSQLNYVYDRQNDCAQSLHHARAALALGNELKSRYVGRYVGNVGAAYACMGDRTEAVGYYRQALEIYGNPQTPDRINLVALLTNLAGGDLANNTEALPLLERALTVAGGITNKVMELRVRLGLGGLHQQNGDHAQALEQTRAALQIAQDTGVAIQEGNSWNQLGRIHLSLFDSVQAMDAHRRALAIGERTQAPQVVWQALAGLAAVLQRQGNLEQAAQHYRQAIETIEGVRSRIGIAEDRASFLADKIDVYKKLLGLLVELQGKSRSEQAAAEAFRYAERARARAFFDLLAEAKVNDEQSAAPDLKRRQQELQQRVSQLTTQLIKERSQETGKQDKAKIDELEKGLSQADTELGDWLRELRSRNPRYAALKYPEPVTLAETQRMLDDKTLLLSYSLAEPASFLFAVTRDDFQVKQLPSEAMLGEGVQKLLAAVTDKNHPAPEEYRRQAVRLSRQLLQPVSHMLAGKNALVIVPDGVLHRLPFEVLLLPGVSAQGDLRRLPYLIQRFAISYAPSASVLAGLQSEPRETAPKGFIAFGDPVYEHRDEGEIASTLRAAGAGRLNFQRLSHSRDEVEGIARMFANNDREIFLGEAASEENVKAPERLSRYRMVHFSTHGYVNKARPRFSGLVLSLPSQSATRNPQSEDGLLSAYEILNLKLRADLVVLSACETGLGKEVKGEGLMSLMRAFMYAGTPSVVVSLWNVNDESAADLMILFYRNLKTGRMSKSEALRQAQLETIHDNGFPFFWAPFVLVGKP
jgi:CHAT domain-containing protein/Tfp pilus assembly protein PilF